MEQKWPQISPEYKKIKVYIFLRPNLIQRSKLPLDAKGPAAIFSVFKKLLFS